MEPWLKAVSRPAVLPDADVDTDVIFPARFLLITAKEGLGRYAFHDWRRQQSEEGRPHFLEAAETPAILIAGPNFGCGSSREQAVWALHDLGVRAILAPSFGEIFRSNCFKSGVLPVCLPLSDLSALSALEADARPITVDLVNRQVRAEGLRPLAFEVEDWRREALLNGWDEVLVLLNTQADAIAAFEQRRRAEAPWLYRRLGN